MTKNHIDILVTSVLLICFAGLLCLNIIFFEVFEKKTLARMEKHEALEVAQQEKIAARQATKDLIELRELARNQDMKDIIGFDEEYSRIKEEYLSKISGISEKLEEKAVNISDIRSLVDKRIDAANKFKENLSDIGRIPAALEDFHVLLLEFLDNDIFTWQEIKSYYSGTYDGEDADIKELYRTNSELYGQTEYLQREIYSGYGLENLL